MKSSERTLSLANERYKSGIDSYLNMSTAQATLLTNQRTAVNLRMQRMTASVELVKALGGGWNSTQLPTPKELVSKKPAQGQTNPATAQPTPDVEPRKRVSGTP